MSGRRALVDRATAELAARDVRLAAAVAAAGRCELARVRRERDEFGELARMIVFQQLAGAAARTIHARFEASFPAGVTPEAVLGAGEAVLRSAGLSAAKAASVTDLAARVAAGDLALRRLARRPDDEVVAALTQVRGIGRWTAEMYLIFRLGRLDVWPADDLGVRRGYSRIHGLADPPTAREIAGLGDPYRPYRSVAAWYCWRAADTVVPTGTG